MPTINQANIAKRWRRHGLVTHRKRIEIFSICCCWTEWISFVEAERMKNLLIGLMFPIVRRFFATNCNLRFQKSSEPIKPSAIKNRAGDPKIFVVWGYALNNGPLYAELFSSLYGGRMFANYTGWFWARSDWDPICSWPVRVLYLSSG